MRGVEKNPRNSCALVWMADERPGLWFSKAKIERRIASGSYCLIRQLEREERKWLLCKSRSGLFLSRETIKVKCSFVSIIFRVLRSLKELLSFFILFYFFNYFNLIKTITINYKLHFDYYLLSDFSSFYSVTSVNIHLFLRYFWN